MRALLDVNVLIALLDADHTCHAQAKNWLSEHIELGWASCPITQNGCVRIMSQPAYPGAQAPALVAARLADATATQWHVFWADSISALDARAIQWDHVLGARQLTDAYLLALAVANDGRLVTFDRAVPTRAVVGAGPHHVVRL